MSVHQIIFDVHNGTAQFVHKFPRQVIHATDAPTVNDDSTNANVTEGSLWFEVDAAKVYWCSDDTDGAAAWNELSSGGATAPGGADTHVQFNDGGAFGGEAGLVYNKTTDTLTIAGGAVVGTTIELGHASDTTLARVSAGVVSIEGVNILTTATGQPLDATLTALAGANWAANSLAIGSGADTVAQVTFAANTFPARASTGDLVAKTITDFALTILDDTTQGNAQTTLGLGTGDSPQFTAVNIGHASDTTITRVSAGVVAVEGVTILTTATGQPLDAQLTSLAALAYAGNAGEVIAVNGTEDGFELVAAGTGTVTGTGTDNRLARWNGTDDIQDSNITCADTTGALTNSASMGGGNLLSFTNTSTTASSTGLYGAATGATGAVFGIVGTTDSTDNGAYGGYFDRGGTDNAGLCALGIDVSEMDAPAAPPTGFYRIYAKSDSKLYGKNDGGTERRLDNVIGTDVQAWDAQLDSLSAASANGVSLVTAANYAAMRALLDLEAGTDFYSIAGADAAFQPLDAQLTSLAALAYAGNAGEVIAVKGTEDGFELVAAGTGTVTGTGTDNHVMRWDGTDDAQDSGVVIDDSNHVTGMASLTLTNTGLHLLDTNATHDLIIAPGSNLTADRTLTITTGDADRTLTLTGDTSLTGTNTGDQTITLTGDVTGTGTGSFAATIANDAVTYAKMQNASAGNVIPARIAGTSGDYSELSVAEERIVGRITGGNVDDLTPDQVRGVIGATDGFATALQDGYIDASVSGNALTLAIKHTTGVDPAAATPVRIAFLDTGADPGKLTTVSLTGANSMTLTSGSQIGFDGSDDRAWIVAFNDGGTVRLGVINCFDVGNGLIYILDESKTYSSTQETAAAADAHGVIYTTGAAVSAKHIRVIGYFEYDTITAGAYASVPARIKLFTPGTPLPGHTIRSQVYVDANAATGTTTVPTDDTIPQSSEGTQFMSYTWPTQGACNAVIFESHTHGTISTTGVCTAAMFRNSDADALAVESMNVASAGGFFHQHIVAPLQKVYTGSQSIKIRIGGGGASTTTFNGSGGNRFYGGTSYSSIKITEIMA